MIEWLDSMISLPSLIWLYLAVFMVHDFEEIIVVERWMRRNGDRIQQVAPKWIAPRLARLRDARSDQFAVPVLLEFIFFIPVTWLAADHGRYAWFLGINMLMLLHVLTHVGQSLLFRRLTPGVVTAVLLIPPYSFYLFHRMFQAGIADWGTLWQDLTYGLIVLPIVLGGHWLSKKLLPGT